MAGIRKTLYLSVTRIQALSRYSAIRCVIQLIIGRFRFSVFLITSRRFTYAMIVCVVHARGQLRVIQTREVRLLRIARRPKHGVPRVGFYVSISCHANLFKRSVLQGRILRPLNRDLRVLCFRKWSNDVYVPSRILGRITTVFSHLVGVGAKGKTYQANYRIVYPYRCSNKAVVGFYRTKDCSASRPFIPFFVMRGSEAPFNRPFRVNSGIINFFHRTLIRILTNFIMLISLSYFLRYGQRVFLHRRISDFFSVLSASQDVSTQSSFRRSVTSDSFPFKRSTSIGGYFRSRAQIAIRLFRSIRDGGAILTRGQRSIQDSACHCRVRREGRIVGLSAITSDGYLRRLRASATAQGIYMQVHVIQAFNI